MKITPLKNKLKAGYTLMEMMLVLFIIALILGGGVYLMQNVGQDAEITKAQSDVKTWETNLIRYKTKNLLFPTQAQGLQAMVTKPSGDPAPRYWVQLAKPEAMDERRFRMANRVADHFGIGRTHDAMSPRARSQSSSGRSGRPNMVKWLPSMRENS
jgi:general secretion pathway protein G